MKKIVILDAKTLGDVPNLTCIHKFGDVISYETTTVSETLDRVKDANIVITNKVVLDKEILEKCKHLELICISATGTNNVDLDAAQKNGTIVKNAVGYSSHSVAQHTFASILKLYHQISYYDAYVKSGKYAKSEIFTYYGPPIKELNKKHFGIIGLGNIGKTVAQIAESFGSKVSYYSTSGKNKNQEYQQMSLTDLLEWSDIVSIHAPLNAQTKNLISKKELNIMNNDAILINVGRGGIVDEAALAKAISEQKIGGACIDVFEKEPINSNNPLLDVKFPEKLVLTPHNAWASIEARTNLLEIVCENIELYLSGKS